MDQRALLTDIFDEVTARIDGGALVAEAAADLPLGPVHVLALGKAAAPMLAGLCRARPDLALASALVITPPRRARAVALPPAEWLVADHPSPGPASERAGQRARAFVARLSPTDRLLILLSGGGSSLAAVPATGLSLDDKRAATTAVARAGASIHELNTVRKHLSAIKGGQLAAACAAEITVLALSDVIGNDLATIASGPFAPDPTTYGDAVAILERVGGPAAAMQHLRAGAAGHAPETPKPGDPRLARVRHRVLAGPERVVVEAERALAARALTSGVLARQVEGDVRALAADYVARAHQERDSGRAHVLVGNGEPTVVVSGGGRGGRATHLALLVAQGISGLSGVTFLAAGTDDRDGNGDAAGAVVDGTSWGQIRAAGLDPESALAGHDSATALGAIGALVGGRGTSNLLDLHLLALAGDGV